MENLNSEWSPAVHRRAPFWIGFGLVVLVAFGVIATGGVSAADVEIVNETVSVNNDTSTAWVEFNNTNATASANLTATFYGVDNGTETELSNSSVTVANGSTKLVESAAVNGTLYESVRIVGTVDNSTVPASNVTATVGTFQKVTGGGGAGGIGGTGLGLGALALIAIAAVLFLGGKDE